MEKVEERDYKAHCLVLPYPTLQGHINPMLQFSKLLHHKGVRVTMVTTISAYNTLLQGLLGSSNNIALETISDGCDQGWTYSGEAESIDAYVECLWQVGPPTLAHLIEKLSSSSCSVDCIVYDSIMPWCLDVAKKYGVAGAAFFTQPCAVGNIFYHVHNGLLKLPLADDQTQISLPGLPLVLEPLDMPSFVYDFGSYPAVLKMLVGQFSNADKADWLLCNTFYELEEQVST